MTQDTQAAAGAQPAPARQDEALRIAMHLRQRVQLSRPGNLDTLSAAGANELERQHAELSTAQAEAKHWRCNHDNVVARLRIFTQRPDIPKELADRLPWYRELVRLQEVEAALQAAQPAQEPQATPGDAVRSYRDYLSCHDGIKLGGQAMDDMALDLARIALDFKHLTGVRAADHAPLITEQSAYDMGAKGAPATEAERVLFEAWMRGHCWALCAEWDGKGYRSAAEIGGEIDPHAMRTRQLFAAWRDRAALQAAPPAPAGVAVPEALRALIEAIEFTPLGVRAIQAMTRARAALAAAPAQAVAVPGELAKRIKDCAAHWAYMERIDHGDQAAVEQQRHAELVDQLASAPAQENRYCGAGMCVPSDKQHAPGCDAAPAQEHATQLAGQVLPADEFRGDTASLVRNIIALLDLDAQGCLVPHGVGGHARGLLSAAASRLAEPAQAQEDARDALTLDELDQLDRAIEHFGEGEDTDVDWRLLTRAASLGYLECERFTVPPTARAAIDAARAAQGSDKP